ncbi:MAG: hypothetical protein EZS28_046683, partial [Streblomastix strix]
LGFELGGIVSSECVSNEASQIPGYKIGTSTEMPPKPTKCDDGTTDVKVYAKGFKSGYINGISNDELKQLLTRVGPMNGEIQYYENNYQYRGSYTGIFCGWEGNEWIIATRHKESSDVFDGAIYYTEDKIPFLIDGSTSTWINGDVFYYDCRYPTSETPATVCPCPIDATKLENDPRKDTICFDCAEKTIETPASICSCPEDLNLLAIDPRKGTLCPPIDCTKKTIDTFVDVCECPTDLNLLAIDPRKGTLCPPIDCTKKTIDTFVDVCPCPEDLNLLFSDPRKGTLCPQIDCSQKTIDTLVDICECPDKKTEKELWDVDPRKDTICFDCAEKTIETPASICSCPEDLNLLFNDPRMNIVCPPVDCTKKTIDTFVDVCECPTNLNLLAIDPRKGTLCPPIDCNKKTIDTLVD